MKTTSFLLALLACAPAARADGPDWQEDAVTDPWNEGLTVGGALLVPTGFYGSDCCKLRGVGGGISLRVGTYFAPRWLWLLQLDTGAVLVRKPAEDGSDMTTVTRNEQATLTLSAQWFASELVWVRGGVGFATYTLRDGDNRTAEANLERGGLAATAAIGFEVWRKFTQRGKWAVDLELIAIGAVYPARTEAEDHGVIAQFGFGLGLQYY